MGTTAARSRRRWHHGAVVAGVVLFGVGAVAIQANGGLNKAQTPDSTDAFNAHVGAHLDDVRAANLADMLLFVPGYLLIGVGGALWVRALRGAAGRPGRLAGLAGVLVIVAAATDTVENVLLRRATGDLPAGDGLVTTMMGFGVVKMVTFVVGFAALVGAAVWRWARRNVEPVV